MSFLIFVQRKHDIIAQKSDINMRLMTLRKKLMDLQSYSASIADGTVSMNDLMHVPPSQFGRMSIFMMYSHQGAMAGADQKFEFMKQIPGAIPQMQNEQMQQQYMDMMRNNLYKQERLNFSKVEEKLLNQQDLKIQQEVSNLETRLTALSKEEEKVAEAEKQAAQQAPSYVA